MAASEIKMDGGDIILIGGRCNVGGLAEENGGE